jgi:hypothetical protein
MSKLFIVAAIITFAISSVAEFRIWEDVNGKIWEGEFVTLSAGEVVMRDQMGARIIVKPEQLSAADQLYLEKVIPPRLSIDVSKTTDNTKSRGSSESVRCLVSMKQTDNRPYTGKLTAVLVVMNEDIKTGSTSVENKKEYSFSLPEKRGEIAEFKGDRADFYRKSGNTSRSGKAYSGYILVIWDRFGNPIAIKSNRDSFAEEATKLARPDKRNSIKG